MNKAATAVRESAKIDFEGPYALSINGAMIETNKSFDVFNPATNAILARAPEATAKHMEVAIAAAKKAFPAWSALSWDERGA
ncbi:MAG TPA: aldehyde dehydrogenase family protein, partial [Sphingobium sp.]